jgi:hypothetical protein
LRLHLTRGKIKKSKKNKRRSFLRRLF